MCRFWRDLNVDDVSLRCTRSGSPIRGSAARRAVAAQACLESPSVSVVTGVVERGSERVELLERNDALGVVALLSERVRGWPVGPYLDDVWMPGLDELTGSPRLIAETIQISEVSARFILEGPHGRAFVTVQLDGDGRLDGLALEAHVFDGIGNLVIACPKERRDELRRLL